MRKYFVAALSSVLLLLLPFSCFADGIEGSEVLRKIGGNIWYILLVVVFGAGLLLISKWSSRIKESDRKLDEQLKKEDESAPASGDEEASENTEAPAELLNPKNPENDEK